MVTSLVVLPMRCYVVDGFGKDRLWCKEGGNDGMGVFQHLVTHVCINGDERFTVGKLLDVG